MRKPVKILYYVTVIISACVGLWHFFVPWLYQWYDYLPMQYENLIVGIDYTNYCFSLLLFGMSFLLIVLGKKVLSISMESCIFYFFLTIVWIFRAMLASFIEPWPLDPIPAAAIGQLIASDTLAILMVIMSGILIKRMGRTKRKIYR
ncbi:MAG: hypothetical protein LUC83_07900 [Clostridiales bacterium]|nr:hypothetical protein [Clostridiales bacterium]